MKSLNYDNIGICILAHNRLRHLKKTLKSVIKYKNKKDKIFIFLDIHSNKYSTKKILLCKKVQNYLENIKSNKIFVLKSKSNIGPKKNWYKAYGHMFKIYKKVIVLEDDIVIKKNFLNFMHYYLNKYEKNSKIMSITGYSSHVELPKNYNYDCYLSNRSMSWSKATWKRVWIKFKKINTNHKIIINNKKNLSLLAQAGEDLLRIIKLDYLKKVNSFQVWWIWNIIKNKGYCINPVKNLVNNIGFDGSGHHIFKKEKFSFNQNNSLKKNKMNKLYYLETINFSFQKNFKMKLLSFLCFKYLHVNIINFLMKLKFSLNK